MRGALAFLALSVAACGSSKHPAFDANTVGDDDAPPETASCPKVLLVGGTDIATQGWSVVMQPPDTLTYGQDYVQLQTMTVASAKMGGQLLLNYPGAVEAGKPFKLQVVMRVESVSPHNQFDSAAAILGSFMTPNFGSQIDRNQMIYLDADKIGWGDDAPPPFPVSVTNNAYHTYELSVDATEVATVTIDGVQALTRTGFVSNGAIAIGDQTNEPTIDSMLHIRSVTKLCP